ncbi:MAG: hypothetical protein LBK50_03940 [Candidatus Nomurabacteria bacterium]|jgi:hypothetical protein|nr:hypothetical protein [Candidatus Nomurabacteria bacterium]
MTKLPLMIFSLLLSIAPLSVLLPTPAKAGGPDKDIYISEVFISGENSYIELLANSASVDISQYYLFTTNTSKGSESANLNLSSEDITIETSDDGHYLVQNQPEKQSVYDVLTKSRVDRTIWLCSSGTTKKDCSDGNFVDSFDYAKTIIDDSSYSWSRDFDDPDLITAMSQKTPNRSNNFDIDEIDEPIDDADNPCAVLKLNEMSFVSGNMFVEVINDSSIDVDITGCSVHRGTVVVELSGLVAGGAIKSFPIDEKSVLIKEPNSTVKAVYIYDKSGKKLDDSVAPYEKVKTGASWAWFDEDGLMGWMQTFHPTPNEANDFQQFQTCEDGKIINVNTGNCVKAPSEPADCAAGQYRNPETGRCKKVDSADSLTPCKEGYLRNPETNRCRKIAIEDTLKACQEGYERNPETNRCRKVVSSEAPAFAVENTESTPETDLMLGLAGGGIALTAGMIGASYRQDLLRGIHGVAEKFRKRP